MKKRNLKSLHLNKRSISNFSLVKAGDNGSITTFRFICTNHPKQETDFCEPDITIGVTSLACISNYGEHSCDCTVA